MTTRTKPEITPLPACACGHRAADHMRELRRGNPMSEEFRCWERGCKCADWRAGD